ncbi:MAG TPA: CotH kinase family protein [Levilinea sp.]|nr:CotH kinase family protein [Levilinea sp.]
MKLRIRRHFPLLLLLALVSAFFTLALGEQRIIAYTVAGRSDLLPPGYDFTSGVNIFDDSLVHSIEIIMDEADYQQMLTTYQQTGIKEYFHADVIIDGTQVSNVGIRLKGNSSLRTAVGGRGGMQLGGAGRGFWNQDGGNPPQMGRNRPERLPGEGQMPDMENMPTPQPGEPSDRENMPEAPQGQLFDPQQMPFETPDSAQTSKSLIPYLIKFDQFVEGQTYQGQSLLAIRTYGSSYNEAMLQEPVTNAFFQAMGLPAARTAYTGVQLNGAAERLYVLSEVIDQTYLEQHFDNASGVLYKAELGSTLSYQGEDPSAYASSFTQQTRKNSADLAPLIEFIRFLSETDDATFESELPDRFDVDAFATYLAINNLLVNTDSIAGMNNNYYLYYDDQAARFTLLMWDANESFGKLNFGGGGLSAATHGLYDTGGGRGAGPGGMGGSNTLVTRFLGNATFKTLYEQKLKEVYQEAFVNGAITAKVDQYASMIRAANPQRPLVDIQAYDQAAAALLDFVEQRQQYLASTPLLGQP